MNYLSVYDLHRGRYWYLCPLNTYLSKLNSPIFHKFFPKTEEEGSLPNSFYEASIYKGQIQTKISPENYKTVSCAYGHKNSQ